MTGENPDPDLYDVVANDDTAYERACLEHARTALIVGRSDDETVRVMLGVSAYLRRNGEPPVHLLAGLHDGGSRAEITEALNLVSPDIEAVDVDDPAVVAAVVRNPGVAAIYHNLASTLDTDGALYRVDVPAGAGGGPASTWRCSCCAGEHAARGRRVAPSQRPVPAGLRTGREDLGRPVAGRGRAQAPIILGGHLTSCREGAAAPAWAPSRRPPARGRGTGPKPGASRAHAEPYAACRWSASSRW